MSRANPHLITIFNEALDQGEPTARAAYLDRACGGDAELRRRVEALLAAHDVAGRFLEPQQETSPETLASESSDPPSHPASEETAGFDGDSASPNADNLVLTAEFSPKLDAGTVISNRYTLRERIGEGGMGEVWAAKQTEPGPAIALTLPGAQFRSRSPPEKTAI